MELKLVRRIFTRGYTAGELFIDEKFYFDTIEDAVRKDGFKIPGKTAIPTGTYKIILSYSKRFKQVMPELIDVPNFTHVRIHSGNSPQDTEGCILVGTSDGRGKIFHSREAYRSLMDIIEEAKGENITIKILNENAS